MNEIERQVAQQNHAVTISGTPASVAALAGGGGSGGAGSNGIVGSSNSGSGQTAVSVAAVAASGAAESAAMLDPLDTANANNASGVTNEVTIHNINEDSCSSPSMIEAADENSKVRFFFEGMCNTVKF